MRLPPKLNPRPRKRLRFETLSLGLPHCCAEKGPWCGIDHVEIAAAEWGEVTTPLACTAV
jgi:hypothetical protein